MVSIIVVIMLPTVNPLNHMYVKYTIVAGKTNGFNEH